MSNFYRRECYDAPEDDQFCNRMIRVRIINIRREDEDGTPCQCRTLKDFSPEEIRALEKQYGCRVITK